MYSYTCRYVFLQMSKDIIIIYLVIELNLAQTPP